MASMSEAADAEGATLLGEIRAISARLAADAEVRERERAELTEIKETIVARVDGLEKVRRVHGAAVQPCIAHGFMGGGGTIRPAHGSMATRFSGHL